MPSITCTNCGAVLKTKDPVPPGKKVKCPKCSEVFETAAEEEAAEGAEPEEKENGIQEEPKPKTKGKAAAAKDDDDDGGGDDDDDDDAPKKGKGKGGDKPKKSNTMLIVIIVVVVVLSVASVRAARSCVLPWESAPHRRASWTPSFDAKKDVIIIKDNPFKDLQKDDLKDAFKDFKKNDSKNWRRCLGRPFPVGQILV